MQSYAVTVSCVADGLLEVIYVDPIDYLEWQAGKHAQDAFPYLSSDEREALITNMCVPCIEEMYADMENDNEEDWADNDMFYPESDDPIYDRDWYVD